MTTILFKNFFIEYANSNQHSCILRIILNLYVINAINIFGLIFLNKMDLKILICMLIRLGYQFL